MFLCVQCLLQHYNCVVCWLSASTILRKHAVYDKLAERCDGEVDCDGVTMQALHIHTCVCLSACLSIYNMYPFVSDVFKMEQLLISWKDIILKPLSIFLSLNHLVLLVMSLRVSPWEAAI